jgi:hypothetical protein
MILFGAEVQHALAVLDEGAALDGDVDLREVAQNEVDQLLRAVAINQILSLTPDCEGPPHLVTMPS